MKILVGASVFHPDFNSSADYAEVEFGHDLKEKIKRFRVALLSVVDDADQIAMFNYAPSFKLDNCDPRLDFCKLVVSKDHFIWSGGLKYSDCAVETNAIPFTVFDDEEDKDLRVIDEDEDAGEEPREGEDDFIHPCPKCESRSTRRRDVELIKDMCMVANIPTHVCLDCGHHFTPQA